jgi:hypothetical protein
MNDFDLINPEAGKQLYERGYQDGLKKGASRLFEEILLDTLIAQFQSVPNEIVDKIYAIDDSTILKELIVKTLSCSDIECFKEKIL